MFPSVFGWIYPFSNSIQNDGHLLEENEYREVYIHNLVWVIVYIE